MDMQMGRMARMGIDLVLGSGMGRVVSHSFELGLVGSGRV